METSPTPENKNVPSLPPPVKKEQIEPMPKKYIPPSAISKVTPNEVLSQSAIETEVEQYPEEKQAIEVVIAEKWKARLKKTGTIEPRDPPAPDIIFYEATPRGETVILIELMELVSARDAHFRTRSDDYMRELQQTPSLGRLFLAFCCEEQVTIPAPSKPKGKLLLKEIREAILASTTGNGNYYESSLNKPSGPVVQIFFSIDGLPTGLAFSPDWGQLEKALNHKFSRNYSLNEDPELKDPVLLLHGSHARPDFSRLSTIINGLQTEHGNRFAEIWYLKPYPQDKDVVQLIYPENLDGDPL